MINWLLRKKFIRRRLLFQIQQNYFHELLISIPINSGHEAHLLEIDSYDSFSEIFINQEYSNFLPKEPISRILDIGAHYGYFSLWFHSVNNSRHIHSLMIEASPRCKRSLEFLISQEQFIDKFTYIQGAISSPNSKSTKFYDRSHMGGSSYPQSNSEVEINVPSLSEEELIEASNQHFDLIKCDIEGSEWEFLCHYSKIIRSAKYILLEWHSWHSGGGGYNQIIWKLKGYNYQILKASKPSKAIGRDGEIGLILARNNSHKN
jgi:FkbM family methyltransferase